MSNSRQFPHRFLVRFLSYFSPRLTRFRFGFFLELCSKFFLSCSSFWISSRVLLPFNSISSSVNQSPPLICLRRKVLLVELSGLIYVSDNFNHPSSLKYCRYFLHLCRVRDSWPSILPAVFDPKCSLVSQSGHLETSRGIPLRTGHSDPGVEDTDIFGWLVCHFHLAFIKGCLSKII